MIEKLLKLIETQDRLKEILTSKGVELNGNEKLPELVELVNELEKR